jgi:predicted TIM-barrel fold metal-dependent hydrolase
MNIDGLGSISVICRKIEEAASHPGLGLVRVVPISVNQPIDSARFYPIYERCEAFRIPVSINVGVPGPRMRVRYQDPMLLDDVLIDFPDLTVVAAHMGHPWERLLIRLMRKYERLHLANSAYLATYLDPAVLRYMDSSIGHDRMIFASDAPLLDLGRALAAAKELPISEAAMTAFLGGNAARILRLPDLASDTGADR